MEHATIINSSSLVLKYSPYVIFCLASPIGLPAFATWQDSPSSFPPAPQIVDTQHSNIKTVYVVVLDKNQNPIADLKREDFSVLENGPTMEIVSVSSASSVPLLVGVAVDSSGSVGQNLQHGKELDVLYRSLRATLASSDKAFVAAFNDETFHLTGVTSNISELRDGIQALADRKARGSTALYDALIDAIRVMSGDRLSRKIIVCVGDFEDNVSEHSLEKTVEYVRNSGVAVFPLVEYDSYERNRHPHETEKGLRVARRIASESGGFASVFESPAELQTALEKLRQILRNSYALRYKGATSDHANKKTLQRPKVTAPGRKDLVVLATISASP